MKEHSERVPGKNVRRLFGEPLFHYLVDTLHETQLVDEIILDIDGPELTKIVMDSIVSKGWTNARISPRLPEFTGDLVGGNRLLERFVVPSKSDYHFMQMHVTSPFIKADTVDYAFKLLEAYGCAFSVTRIAQRIWHKPGPEIPPIPVNFDPYGPMLRTQDLPHYCHENGAFFAFRGSYFLQNGGRRNTAYSAKTVELDFPESVDIDTEDDFELAEAVCRMNFDKGGQ